MSSIEYSADERAELISLARRSIDYGLAYGCPLHVNQAAFPPHLREERACFVTLHRERELRGCTGTISPQAPLVVCVAGHAFTSAFRDSRFPPLERVEVEELVVSVSVLSSSEPLDCADEDDLLAQLRLGIDGLILEEGDRIATLLPSVWATLPKPERFLGQLKRKAGLASDYWSPTLRFFRYTTEEFS